jgi:hypothetical protein
MRSFTRLILLAGLALAASPAYAMTDPGDIGTVIESFVTRQFPDEPISGRKVVGVSNTVQPSHIEYYSIH